MADIREAEREWEKDLQAAQKDKPSVLTDKYANQIKEVLREQCRLKNSDIEHIMEDIRNAADNNGSIFGAIKDAMEGRGLKESVIERTCRDVDQLVSASKAEVKAAPRVVAPAQPSAASAPKPAQPR